MISAKDKYHCPSCAADAHWDAGKQALVCGYCGTVSPAEISAEGEIKEHCLVTAIRSIPDSDRGWDAERISVKCQSCQAVSVFSPNRVAQNCDFCGAAALIPVTEQTRPIRPESVLAFKIAETKARELAREWYGSRWFAPNAMNSRSLTDTVHGVYIPYWTFDAQVHADWTAMAGHYYYETESYTDAQGNRGTRQVRKTRWVPASGSIEHFFDDELIPGTRGVDGGLLARVANFPTGELTPYDPGYLAGWVVEQYQIDLVAAAQHARETMDAAVERLCASDVPGDTHRDLDFTADYSQQTFKHILVPLWLINYDYGSQRYQLLINGYNGTIAGTYPKSWIKIALLVLAILAVIGLIAALQR